MGSDQTIPLCVPDLRGREAEYLTACVRDNWVSSAGPFVTDFEARVAETAGRRHGVATVNGTTALHLALLAAGVGPNDLVIVPDWTFAATANAVYHAGATPYFVDITRESWTLDPGLTGQAIEEATKDDRQRIGAVIAVHALGHPADLDPLIALCSRHGIPLIEDAAGAIGARYKGRPVGSFGDAAVFSFNGNKTVTAGGGGMIVSDRSDWMRQARALSTQARSGAAYRYDAIGFNYRMTNINAAVGVAQMERLDDMIAAKRRIAQTYDAAMQSRGDLISMPRCGWADSACWLYSVLCPSRRDASDLVAVLDKSAISARVFWQSLSQQAPYSDAPTLLSGVSEELSGRVVTLPCSSSLPVEDQERVLGVLADWSARKTDAGNAGLASGYK